MQSFNDRDLGLTVLALALMLLAFLLKILCKWLPVPAHISSLVSKDGQKVTDPHVNVEASAILIGIHVSSSVGSRYNFLPKFMLKFMKFSRKMSPVLQVKMLLEYHFSVDLSQVECPDLLDVALYFFPADNIERSRQLCEAV